MNAPASITITPVRVADLLAEGERMPVYVYVIDHPDARVLVDTGMTELHPLVADLDPRLRPLSKQGLDLAGIDIVVKHTPALRPLRRQPPLRRQADLRPASRARRRGRVFSAWSRTWSGARRRETSGSPPGSGSPSCPGP